MVGPSRTPGPQDPGWGGRAGAGQAQTRGSSATPTCELHKHPASALNLACPAVRATSVPSPTPRRPLAQFLFLACPAVRPTPGRLSPVPHPADRWLGFSSPSGSLLSPRVLFRAKLDLAFAWRFPGVASCVGVRVPGGAGLRLLGTNSPMPTATTVNPRGPQTSIFHLTVPLGPPGSEVPLSPAQLHRGYPGPQLPTQNQGCPGHWPPPGSAVAPGQPGGAPGHPPAVSPGHLSLSTGCPPARSPSGAPNRAACHR